MQNAAGVVHLDLTNGPTVITDLEIPHRVTPAVELIASGLVPATAEKAVGHGERLPLGGAIICRGESGGARASGDAPSVMTAFPSSDHAVVASDDHVLRAAVAAYLGRYRGESRVHAGSDLGVFLTWRAA